MIQSTHRLPWPTDRQVPGPTLVRRTHCDCASCAPPSRLAPDARRTALTCAAGIAVGLLLVLILDRLIGGPGLGVMLGW